MNLKNTSAFLFIAAIVVLCSEVFEHIFLYIEGATYSFRWENEIFSVSKMLNAVIFLLLGVSYMRPKYNPATRKLLGTFLIVTTSIRITVDLYGLYDSFFNGGIKYLGWSHFVTSALYMLMLIPLLITGVALANGDRRRVRSSMIGAMISFGGTLVLIIYSITMIYVEGRSILGSNMGSIWFWIGLFNLLQISLTVAQFLWSIAVYQRLGGQTDPTTIKESAVIDEL